MLFRRSLLAGTAGLAAVGLTGSRPAQAQTPAHLTVVGFGGALQNAFRKAYWEPYAAQHGVKLTEESYDGGIARLKAMVLSSATTWDVVQMDENEMILAGDEGLLERFDWKTFTGAADIRPEAKSDYGVGAFVWSKVIAYDGKRVSGVSSWSDLWDTTRWPGKRALRKQARMTLEIALLADGVAPKDVYSTLSASAGVDRAFAKLDQIKPQVQWWETGAQPLEWIASGDVVIAAAYNGRVAAARTSGRDFRISWNQQLYAMDFWARPKGSKNPQAAQRLVEAMVAPEGQARFAEAIPYGLTNNAASARLPEALQNQLPTSSQHLEGALLVSTPFWVDHEEELQRRFSLWVSK